MTPVAPERSVETDVGVTPEVPVQDHSRASTRWRRGGHRKSDVALAVSKGR
jgi:hypothetical protein